jgi:type 1 glutamine amidotransferase
MNEQSTRRSILRAALGSAVGLTVAPFLSSAAEPVSAKRTKILFFTRSQKHPHSVVTRKSPDELAFAEALFKQWGDAAGYDITCSKDGGVFEPGVIEQLDAFAFYTSGDPTKPKGDEEKSDKTPPMSARGKDLFLQAIASGKGLIGFHNASGTFLSKRRDELLRPVDVKDDSIDPFIQVIGGEFVGHGKQQKATLRATDSHFPGLVGLKDVEQLHEEWYTQNNLAPDLHVILVQDTATMVDAQGKREPIYQRDPYPQTWARMHGKGRVFYTSLGHREDVWTNPLMKQIALAGLRWVAGDVEADITPNLKQACPQLANPI